MDTTTRQFFSSVGNFTPSPQNNLSPHRSRESFRQLFQVGFFTHSPRLPAVKESSKVLNFNTCPGYYYALHTYIHIQYVRIYMCVSQISNW